MSARQCACALLLGGWASVLAAQARLDRDYQGSGLQLDAIPGAAAESWQDLVVDDNGRAWLVGGRVNEPGAPNTSQNWVRIGRNLADGTPDPAFSNLGRGVLDLSLAGGGSDQELLSKALLLPDGKLLAAGQIRAFVTVGTADLLLMRIQTNGEPDSSYGNGGARRLVLGQGSEAVSSLLGLPDGHVLLFADDPQGPGSSDNFVPTMLRLTTTGDPDPGFAAVRHEFTPGIGSDRSFQARLDGEHVLVAGVLNSGAASEGGVWRMRHLDGGLDGSFGVAGLVRLQIPGGEASTARDMLRRGSAVLALVNGRVSGVVQAAVVGLDAQGQIDPNFGDNGWLLLPGPASTGFELMAVDRGYWVMGRVDVGAASDDLAVWAFDSAGRLDSRFAPGGWLRFDTSGTNRRDVFVASDYHAQRRQLTVAGNVRGSELASQAAVARLIGAARGDAHNVPGPSLLALALLVLLLLVTGALGLRRPC